MGRNADRYEGAFTAKIERLAVKGEQTTADIFSIYTFSSASGDDMEDSGVGDKAGDIQREGAEIHIYKNIFEAIR